MLQRSTGTETPPRGITQSPDSTHEGFCQCARAHILAVVVVRRGGYRIELGELHAQFRDVGAEVAIPHQHLEVCLPARNGTLPLQFQAMALSRVLEGHTSRDGPGLNVHENNLNSSPRSPKNPARTIPSRNPPSKVRLHPNDRFQGFGES